MRGKPKFTYIPAPIADRWEKIHAKYLRQKSEISRIKKFYPKEKFNPEIHLSPELRKLYYKMQELGYGTPRNSN